MSADLTSPQAVQAAAEAMVAMPSQAATTHYARCLVANHRQADATLLFEKNCAHGDYALLMSFGQLFTQIGERERAIAAYDAAASSRPYVVGENTAAPASWVQNSPYTRAAPSPRYGELIAQYELMHQAALADAMSEGAKTFEGFVGFSIMAPYIRRFARAIGARSLLDYGGGRGNQYRLGAITIDGETFEGPLAYLGIERAVCYDPGHARTLPPETFDLVICIDALEHCDRHDLPWIVRELFSKADKGVLVNIAAYPAGKVLPNGENAHCTIEEAPWWMELFSAVAAEFPRISYEAVVAKDLRQNDHVVFGHRTE
jgi:hypothetical protein